ncbi:hypothetical protein ACJX0J_035476 [Zea mays]
MAAAENTSVWKEDVSLGSFFRQVCYIIEGTVCYIAHMVRKPNFCCEQPDSLLLATLSINGNKSLLEGFLILFNKLASKKGVALPESKHRRNETGQVAVTGASQGFLQL